MTPESREKTAKTAVFRHRWRAWKVVRSITAVRQRPRMPRNLRCSFAFFESFLWHFNKKQRAEAIFRLSRPVSCKNQENGSGNHWSLHTPHKLILYKTVNLAFLECSSPGLVKVCCWNGELFLEYLTSFRLRQDPLIWVFGHIWLFCTMVYKKWRGIFCENFIKKFKGKLVKCATEVARLHKVSIQSCTQNGRLRKFSRAREIEFNFFIAWTVFGASLSEPHQTSCWPSSLAAILDGRTFNF